MVESVSDLGNRFYACFLASATAFSLPWPSPIYQRSTASRSAEWPKAFAAAGIPFRRCRNLPRCFSSFLPARWIAAETFLCSVAALPRPRSFLGPVGYAIFPFVASKLFLSLPY
jgi:hypothetical protein